MKQPRGLSPRSLRLVATHSVVAGLCPLIPVPFVDDMIIRRITRRMHTRLFAAHGLTLSPAGAKALSAAPTGWVRGAATTVAWMPVRRLLRKAVIVMAVKDCADVASSVFHDGWLVAHLLERGPRPDLGSTRQLEKVRKAMLETYRDIDPAPLRRALVGAFLGAKVGATEAVAAARQLRKAPEDAPVQSRPVEKLVKRMRDAADQQWKYLDALVGDFNHHLGLTTVREHVATAVAG